MFKIGIEDRILTRKPRETVLYAMIRQGERVRFSCKQGNCHTCKLDHVDGEIPAVARRGLSDTQSSSFLPCLCIPKGDISIRYPDEYQDYLTTEESPFEFVEEQSHDQPRPDPELFKRLEQEDLLNKILRSFYTEVYNDQLLRPFFKSVTMDRAIEKQYNFLYMLFSGEPVYIGDRPRNAHHWMVISDELFDYREAMMERHMIKHGLERPYIDRWRTAQAYFKKRMVKSRPWKKIIDGYHYPLEGLETIIAEVGMVCDQCHQPIATGEEVKYHVHLGEVYCQGCSGDT